MIRLNDVCYIQNIGVQNSDTRNYSIDLDCDKCINRVYCIVLFF